MVLLYTASSVYHWLLLDERGTLLLRKLDHAMIYILIAGTYTPYCLLAMDGTTKWAYLISIWVLAKAGILVKLVWFHAPRWLSTPDFTYLWDGWPSGACQYGREHPPGCVKLDHRRRPISIPWGL